MIAVFKGTIRGFAGSAGRAAAYLNIEDENGMTVPVPCNNANTVRILEETFGNVLDKNNKVKTNGGHIGQEIFFSLDEDGRQLLAFNPVKGAREELVRAYELTKGGDE